MNYQTARTTLATLLAQVLIAFPSLDVDWDNTGTLDLNHAGDLNLCVEYVWDDAGQITLGDAPLHRTTGSLFLTLKMKEGTGVKQACELMDALTEGLKYKQVNGLNTSVPKPGRSQNLTGWRVQELHVPFYFDSNT